MQIKILIIDNIHFINFFQKEVYFLQNQTYSDLSYLTANKVHIFLFKISFKIPPSLICPM